MEDVIVVAGGIIPQEDREPLRRMGVRGIFGPGAATGEIVQFIRHAVEERGEAGG